MLFHVDYFAHIYKPYTNKIKQNSCITAIHIFIYIATNYFRKIIEGDITIHVFIYSKFRMIPVVVPDSLLLDHWRNFLTSFFNN